jgi:DNA polymerase elongation subunit (family B)
MNTTVKFSELPAGLCGPGELKLRELDGYFTLGNDNVLEVYVKRWGQYIKREGAFDKKQGYIGFTFYDKATKKPFTVKLHRLVALAFIPNDIPEHNYVNHRDLNKQNNSLTNLEWTTQSNNIIHAIINGAHEKLFTQVEVESIYRRIHEGKERVADLAAEYDVSVNTIRDIRNNKTYKFFTESIPLSSTNFHTTLSPQEVKEIYDLSRNKYWSQKAISETYDIHFSMVSLIKHGKRYAHITSHVA